MTEVTWDQSRVIGPRQVARLGEPDAETGERELLGWMPGYRLIVARDAMTPEAEAFLSDPQPENPQNRFWGDERQEDGSWKVGAYLVFPDGEEGEAAAVAALPHLCTVPPAEAEPEGEGAP